MEPWPSDIVGQEEVLERLEAEARSPRRAHAYLFSGPRGVGKALAARGFVRRVLCAGSEPPCGSCPSCRALEAGVHPDVDRLAPPEGRRTLPVEQVRRLIERIALRPALGTGRAFLIDEAHLLSEEGANALLKTLEEPPSGSLLVLCTDREEALLPTLLSRSRIVTFRPPSLDACAQRLREQGVPDEEARSLAFLAQGSPARAETLRASPAYRSRAAIVEKLLDLDAANLCDTADVMAEAAGVAGAGGGGLHERRERLMELLDFLALFAWDGARSAWGAEARLGDLRLSLLRTRTCGPRRWMALAERFRQARGEVLAHVVPGLVLDAALADAVRLLRGGGRLSACTDRPSVQQ